MSFQKRRLRDFSSSPSRRRRRRRRRRHHILAPFFNEAKSLDESPDSSH